MTTRLEQLKEAFARNLARTLADDPSYYAWKAEELPDVTARMLAAIDRAGGLGGINIQSRTFTRTAREFGIKNTYKAWAAWLAADVKEESDNGL
jgi:hypothetical protein